jgi:hypothetical protein
MVKDGKTGTAKIHRENGIRLRKKRMSERMNESQTFEAMVQSKRRMPQRAGRAAVVIYELSGPPRPGSSGDFI